MDWTPLADDDPLPGDPGGVDGLCRRFAELAETLEREAGRVMQVDPDRAWTGLAAARFATARDEVPRRLRAVAQRCARAADALRRWAGDLEECQTQGRWNRDLARQALQDAADARMGIAAIEAHHQRAASAASAWNRAHPDGPTRSPQPWVGPDWPALLEEADERLARARRDFAEAVEQYRDAARRATRDLAGADQVLDDPGWVPAPVAEFVGRVLRMPDRLDFVVTDRGLVRNTAEAWRWEAYRQAGIDPLAWDPTRGVDELDQIVVDAWSFYAELFQRRPDEFLWAGMATLAGGTFYAAFQDLHVLRRGLEDGSVGADQVGEVVGRTYPGLPGGVVDQLGEFAARDLDAFAREVRHAETEFLDMQRQIFHDLAWQHVAYEQGGLEAMETLYDRGQLSDEHVAAWRNIATGEDGLVRQGNRALLRHEQLNIIGDDYDELRGHSQVTWAVTLGMSVLAHSPVPGGRPFREVVPHEVRLDTPDRVPLVPDPVVPDRIPFTDVDVPGGDGIHVDTPDAVHLARLPINNVSIFEHRWEWIQQDMLPAWEEHVEDGTAASLVAEPIPVQAERQRFIPDSLLTYEME